MSYIKDVNQLQEALDADLAWRKKEISTLKVASSGAREANRAYARAGVAILYAHWEGYIKKSAESYLLFVSGTGLTYRELKTCFVAIGLRRAVLEVSSSGTSSVFAPIEFIRGKLDSVAVLNIRGAVKTDSNLSSTVFRNVVEGIGLDAKPYETKFKLLDSSLLERRNKITHGDYLDLRVSEFSDLANDVVGLMDQFKVDILNAAVVGAYKFGG